MPSDNPSNRMPWEPEPETVERYLLFLIVLGLVMVVVGVLGEVLGWWNDTGEVLATVGALVSLLVSAGFGVYTSSRRQVQGVRQAVLENGVQLGKLDKLDKLEVIERALVAEDRRTSKLDVVQVELDRQTDVLDRQVGLLTQIRDRL